MAHSSLPLDQRSVKSVDGQKKKRKKPAAATTGDGAATAGSSTSTTAAKKSAGNGSVKVGTSKIRSANLAPTYSAFPGGSTSSLHLPSSAAYNSVVGNASAIASSESLGYSNQPEPLFLPPSRSYAQGSTGTGLLKPESPSKQHRRSPVPSDPKGKGRASQDLLSPGLTYNNNASRSSEAIRKLDDYGPAVDILDAVRFAGLMPPPRLGRSTSQEHANSPHPLSPGETHLSRTTSTQSAHSASDAASMKGTIASTSSAVDTGAESSKQQPAKKKKKAKIFPEQRHTRPKEPFTQVIIGSALTNANLDVRRPNAMATIATTAATAQPAPRPTSRSAHAAPSTERPRRREERATRRTRQAERPRDPPLIMQPTSTTGLPPSAERSSAPMAINSGRSTSEAAATPTDESNEPAPPPWTAPESTITLAFTPMHAYIAELENVDANHEAEQDVPDSPTTAAFMAALGQSSPSRNRAPTRSSGTVRIPDSPPPEFRSRPPSPQTGESTDGMVMVAGDHWPDVDPETISIRSRGYASSENEVDLVTSAGRGLDPSEAPAPESDGEDTARKQQRQHWQKRRWEAWRREGLDAETRWQRLQQTLGSHQISPPTAQQPEASTSAVPVSAAAPPATGKHTDSTSSLVPPRPIANPPVTTDTTAEVVARVQAARIPETSTLLRPQQAPLVREPSPAPSSSSVSEPRSSVVSAPNASSSARFPSIGTVRRARLARFEAQRQNSKTMSSVIETSPSSSAIGVPPLASTPTSAPVAATPQTSTSKAAEASVEGSKAVEATSSDARPAVHQLAKRLSAEIEARKASQPETVVSDNSPAQQGASSSASNQAIAQPRELPGQRVESTSTVSTPQTTSKAKKKSAGTVANRISRLIRPQSAAKAEKNPAEIEPKEPPEMTLPRAPPRVTTDPLSEDNLRRLSRHQERPTNLRSSLSQSSSSEAESDPTSESSFDNAKSDSDSDSADDESTRKPASTLVSYPAGAPPPTVSVASRVQQFEGQKEIAAASWRRSEDGRRHSALLSRPLSIKRKPPPVPAKRWGGIWDKSIQLFDNLEEEFNKALAENSSRMLGSLLSKVTEDEEPGWQTVAQPNGPPAPRLPNFAWETAGRDDVPPVGSDARATSLGPIDDRPAVPQAQQQLPRRLPPLPASMVTRSSPQAPPSARSESGAKHQFAAEQTPATPLRPAAGAGGAASEHSAPEPSGMSQFANASRDQGIEDGYEDDVIPSTDAFRRPSAPLSGSLRRAPATRRPQSVSYPRQTLPTPPHSPNGSVNPPEAIRASLNARPRHVYSASLPTNNLPASTSKPRRPLPTPPADATLPEGVVPAFFAPHPFTVAEESGPVTKAVLADQPSPSPKPTEIDSILSDIEGSGVDPQTAEEILGLTRPATAEEIDSLPVGRVELERKRIDKNGKVKQKLSCVGINCNKCNICLIQFKEDELAAVLPLCCHVFHAEPCIRSYLSTNNRCPSCQTPLV